VYTILKCVAYVERLFSSFWANEGVDQILAKISEEKKNNVSKRKEIVFKARKC